jgi:hypothetical protein
VLHRVFHLLWALHLGLLLIVPKLLHEWGVPDLLHSVSKLQLPALQKLTGLLAAPILDLCSMASVPSIWLPQVHLLAAFLDIDTCSLGKTTAAFDLTSWWLSSPQ